MSELKYQDFEEMISDIRKHVELNDATIINSDESKKLQIGFSCSKTSTRWLIKLSDLKNTGKKYHQFLISKEKRLTLLNAINKNLWTFL